MTRTKTYNAPEYFVGNGATMDLLILLIRACISCLKQLKDNYIYIYIFKIQQYFPKLYKISKCK